jgi:virulence-associated protein VagC
MTEKNPVELTDNQPIKTKYSDTIPFSYTLTIFIRSQLLAIDASFRLSKSQKNTIESIGQAGQIPPTSRQKDKHTEMGPGLRRDPMEQKKEIAEGPQGTKSETSS